MGNFPKKLKVGTWNFKLIEDGEELKHKNLWGECCFLGRPPTIVIRTEDNPCPGDTLFHEIAHGVEGWLGLEYLDSGDRHNAFLSAFYSALRQNKFLATTLICKDY